MKKVLKLLSQGIGLSEQEMQEAVMTIMAGEATDAQIGAFLGMMALKGVTVDELTGGAKAMRAVAAPLDLQDLYTIDTCGTGGDGGKTFNVSTAAAFVAAGAGAYVAKHGNRSISSNSGSADVLKELGVNINLSPQKSSRALEEIGITFLFAPDYHTAMKHVAPGLSNSVFTSLIVAAISPICSQPIL